MMAKNQKPVFTYQTRVSTTREQEVALSRYAVLFGRVERALYADLARGEGGPRLKSEYLVRWGITARQFNAVRIQVQGKIDSVRALLPLQIDDLRTKIRQAKRTIARLERRRGTLWHCNKCHILGTALSPKAWGRGQPFPPN